jgi:uncharacterized cupredoxin-like copper-binding protein
MARWDRMRLVRAPMLLAVLVLMVAGCSSSGGKSHGAVTVAPIVEKDFKITAGSYHLRAGEVDLSVKNDGPDAHELIVVRENGSGLPLRADGLTVNEDAVEKRTLGALEPGQPGKTRQMQVNLTPGRYLLICNMAGHYLGGMHTELVVS